MNPSILVEAPQRAIAAGIQSWLQEHPILAWVFTHPLISVGILLAGIVLFRGLLDAIARLTEHLWLTILQAPMHLVNWLIGVVIRPTNLESATTTSTDLPTRQQQLATILNRLEALKQEQDKLFNEVRTLLEVEQP